MIALHIDSNNDTNYFSNLFDDLSDCIFLYNPSRDEFEDVLAKNPNDTLLCIGHGSPSGLFNSEIAGYIIDSKNVHLLANRKVIGIWCFASTFAKNNNLHGFFTGMFISNAFEASCYETEHTDEEVFAQNIKFSKAINKLINDNVPLSEWNSILQEFHDDVDFVNFNYDLLTYYP